MAVVTISREYGTSGGAIAQRAAELLGYHFVDRETIGRILAGYGMVDFREEYEEVGGFLSMLDSHRKMIFSMLDRVTRSIARHGNAVILGRGSFVTLSGYVDVLNVRIQAPLQSRISKVEGMNGALDSEAAAEEVKRNDRRRAAFVTSVYNVRWDQTELFDIVLNTAKVPQEAAAKWIATIADGLATRTPSGEIGIEGLRRCG
ncbi:MAG: cytidylate kinase-like family protein, partial [Spirochaetaceae bacterium]|nr:cytidylate kinase-like family protein [Spirochaetaceae bacterium]